MYRSKLHPKRDVFNYVAFHGSLIWIIPYLITGPAEYLSAKRRVYTAKVSDLSRFKNFLALDQKRKVGKQFLKEKVRYQGVSSRRQAYLFLILTLIF